MNRRLFSGSRAQRDTRDQAFQVAVIKASKHGWLAYLWAQYNGQRGTESQLTAIMRDLSVGDLVRMLAERNVISAFSAAEVSNNG